MEETPTLAQTSESVQHKCNECNYNLVDHISDFPDEILAIILSFLPLKEAVATSVLSRRWRYAWTSTMNLDFDAGRKTMLFLIELKPKSLDMKSHRYVHWVNRMLEQHTGPNIKKLRASFNLDDRFASSIDRWVQFAMRKRVEVLELDLRKLDYDPYEDLYSFSPKLLGHEKGSAFTDYTGFKPLKVLYLECVDVTDEVVEYFLSHCPVLERLSVALAKSLANVRVVGPSIRSLKYLKLKLCYDLRTVEIRDTNLVSFINEGNPIELILSNVPFLVEVSTVCDYMKPSAMWDVFAQLSCRLSQLETLKLDICSVTFHANHVFPVLANLKYLELTVDKDYNWGLSRLSSFMKASPSMQILVLKFPWDQYESKKIYKAAKCPHYNLRVVEVVGYLGRTNVDEHIIYLIENAVELEKIVIDPVEKWMLHHTGMDMRKRYLKREAKARSHAMHQLKVKVPSTIEFVCL